MVGSLPEGALSFGDSLRGMAAMDSDQSFSLRFDDDSGFWLRLDEVPVGDIAVLSTFLDVQRAMNVHLVQVRGDLVAVAHESRGRRSAANVGSVTERSHAVAKRLLATLDRAHDLTASALEVNRVGSRDKVEALAVAGDSVLSLVVHPAFVAREKPEVVESEVTRVANEALGFNSVAEAAHGEE